MTTIVVGDKQYRLKYKRRMPRGEVERMKSFKALTGETLKKTDKFKIKKVQNVANAVTNEMTNRIYHVTKGSIKVSLTP